MSRTKKCKHKITDFRDSSPFNCKCKHIGKYLCQQVPQTKIKEQAVKAENKKNTENKENRENFINRKSLYNLENLNDRENAKAKEVRANIRKERIIDPDGEKETKDIVENIGNANKEKRYKPEKRTPGLIWQPYMVTGIAKGIINIEGTPTGVAGGWYARRNENEGLHMQALKEEVRKAIKQENKRELKKEKNPEVIKYVQHNHIWHKNHTKNLIEKMWTRHDDEVSSLEFGWTEENEIVLSDFRKKEDTTPCNAETNENLTNKELILETLSEYTSDFDECSINKFIDEHKNTERDRDLDRDPFVTEPNAMEYDINKEKYLLHTNRSFQSNSRTLTFTASTDKYGHTCEAKNFDVFAKTLQVDEDDQDSETRLKTGEKCNRKSSELSFKEFAGIYNLNDDFLLSDRISHFHKKKKNSFFCRSKTRLFSMVGFVKRKWSLTLFSKKKIPQMEHNITAQNC